MKTFYLTLILMSASAAATDVPIVTVSDSINPGTADYITSQIQAAQNEKAPYLVLQLDTPGGLLNSTRQIVEEMLNAKIPVVVFVGPRGAHAGSAGALITFAADVAAMAPGTNIGAAHPVAAGGTKMDAAMDAKITNDTAAFAEGLAKAKGRNFEWAANSVRKSDSITSDEALKHGVIDLIADDTSDLMKKLVGFKLKMAKDGVQTLSDASVSARPIPMTIKQRLVAFFSDPNLAYLVLTLGGLCVWLEMSHPGLIFPGILGGICFLISMVSFQMLPIHYGALALIVLGMGLLIAELFLPMYGVLGVGGLLSFVFGSLFLMDTTVPEFQISWKLILPTAGVIGASAFLLAALVLRSRKTKVRSGMDAMVGEFGEVKETLSKKPGKIFVQGEIWNAVSKTGDEIPSGAIVVVTEVRNMLLVVTGRA